MIVVELGMHPHQGFEFITNVIKGNAYHRNTLGQNTINRVSKKTWIWR